MASILVEQTYLLPNKYKSICFQIMVYCFANEIPLSKGEIETLSFFYIHGISDITDELILKKGIFKNSQSLKNVKTKFFKLNLLKRDNRNYIINNFMKIGVADKIGVNIKAGNRD